MRIENASARKKGKMETNTENAASTAARTKQVIVIVDDDKDVLELTKAIFEQYGYEVWHAPDGEKALELIADLCNEKSQPDIIVSDVNMPHVDGVEMARILAMGPIHGRIPILFVSGALTGYSLEDLKPYGGHFLQKPFQFEELRRAVYDIIENASKAPGVWTP